MKQGEHRVHKHAQPNAKQNEQASLCKPQTPCTNSMQQQQQQQSLPFWGRSVLKREAFTKEKRYFPQFLGGILWTLTPVASCTQLSRPITLGHHTSWNARLRWRTYKVLVTKPAGPARKVSPGGFQGAVLKHFWPSPKSEPRKPPEDCFEVFLAPARKLSPGGFQRIVLTDFWSQPGKCFLRLIWKMRALGSTPKNMLQT